MHYRPVQPYRDAQMPAVATKLEAESTLTDRYQTTMPETVRRALKLGKRDKIHYTMPPQPPRPGLRDATGLAKGV